MADLVKIPGYKYVDGDSKQPNGKRQGIGKTGRKYCLGKILLISDSNEPFFSGRDSVPKKTVAEIEHERKLDMPGRTMGH
jgi:hypothetical protein